MSSVRSLIRQLLEEDSLLKEGPLEKMRNSGVPAPIAEFLYEFLPDECKPHSLWFVKQLIATQHQFEDNFKRYKDNIKLYKKSKDDKYLSRAKVAVTMLKQVISMNDEDIKLVCNWTTRTKTNLSKAKFVELVGEKGRYGEPAETEKVPLDLGSAVQAARQYFDMSDGETILDLANGWHWLDRQTSSCSVEASLMGHCGQSGNSGSTLLSLRDAQGYPHITIEAEDTSDGHIIHQVKGKANATPDEKYWPMIFSLMKSDAIDLYSWNATGEHGGDLQWEMIPEEEQQAIGAANENFQGVGDSKEQQFEEANEKITEAISNFSHDLLSAWGDVDWMDDEEFYCKIDIGANIEIPEKIMNALNEFDKNNPDKRSWEKPSLRVVERALEYFNIPTEDIEFENDGEFRFNIQDEDLSAQDYEGPINAMDHWERNDITTDEFLEKVIEELVDEEAYDVGMSKLEDLQLSNFGTSWDGQGEDHWLLAEANMGYATSYKLDYEAFTKEFISRIVSEFNASLNQLILPHITDKDINKTNLTPYPEASLYNHNGVVTLQFKFTTQDEEVFKQGVDLLQRMDNNMDEVKNLYNKMLYEYTGQRPGE